MSKKKDKKSSKAINSDLYIPNMLKAYREHVVPSMVSRFNYDNSMQVPQILSIALNHSSLLLLYFLQTDHLFL